MTKKINTALFISLTTLPALACSYNFSIVGSTFCSATLTLLAILLCLQGKLSQVLILGILWGLVKAFSFGFPLYIWVVLVIFGLATVISPLLKEQNPKLVYAATTGTLAGALLFYWALGSTPLAFRQSCRLCYNKMADVGRQIENYKFEHGELPATLEPLGSPGCLELEASGLGRWLYGLQGIKLVPYRYQVQGDSFTLSCETGTHDWGGGPPKGYPRYSTSTGVVQRP